MLCSESGIRGLNGRMGEGGHDTNPERDSGCIAFSPGVPAGNYYASSVVLGNSDVARVAGGGGHAYVADLSESSSNPAWDRFAERLRMPRGQLWCSFRKAWRAKGKRLSAAREEASTLQGSRQGTTMWLPSIISMRGRDQVSVRTPRVCARWCPLPLDRVQVEGGAVAALQLRTSERR